MRFSTKPGTSFFTTTGSRLRSLIACTIASQVACVVSAPAMTSMTGMMKGGFDQCIPTTRPGAELPSCSVVTGMPEVLEARMHSFETSLSRSANTARLISTFSGTLSSTISQPATASARVS